MQTTAPAARAARPIPGPKEPFFVGSARQLIAGAPEYLSSLADTYGPLVRFSAFAYTFHLVADPEMAREVLVTRAADFPKDKRDVDLLSRFIGYGLVTANGEAHRRQRALVQPAFHSRRIETYASTMVDATATMLDDWAAQNGRPLDVSEAMRELTMNIVLRSLFGSGPETLGEAGRRAGEAIHTLQGITDRDFQAPLAQPIWLPTATNRDRRRARAVLDEVINRLVSERRRTAVDGRVADTGDLLSMLLLAQDEAGQGMSDDEVRDQLVTLFVAGHETTSNALTWTWYLLSQYPDAEARLQAEVDAALGDRLPTAADLPRLPYTLMVIKEAMRLYPPAWLLNTRRATAETRLGDYVLPRGARVWISPFAMHRRPQFFPDPQRFDPERFTPEREKALPRYAYMPFGAGPRVCIGNSFALMEAQIIIAVMARRVRLRLMPDQAVALNAQVTLSNHGGMHMRPEPR